MLPHRFHRRPNRLPAQVYKEPGRFFLTVCTEARAKHFSCASIVQAVEQELRAQAPAYHLDIDAYCFMPDHLHVLISSSSGTDVPGFMKELKQRTAFRLHKEEGIRLWQKGYYDHVLRREEETKAVAEYILHNPVRAGLCKQWEEYPYSWSRWHDQS